MESPDAKYINSKATMSVAVKPTDEHLMEQVYQGKLDALSALFNRYQVPLYNFFYRQNFDGPSSEDMVQAVFERVLKYRRSYQNGMSFRTWIYQIARNVRVDFHKSRGRVSDFVEVDQLELQIDSVERQLTHAEELVQLKKAMAYLSDSQREIIVMTRFQKMKYKEVASILNCSEGAVKVKVHRALSQLRQLFFKLEQN